MPKTISSPCEIFALRLGKSDCRVRVCTACYLNPFYAVILSSAGSIGVVLITTTNDQYIIIPITIPTIKDPKIRSVNAGPKLLHDFPNQKTFVSSNDNFLLARLNFLGLPRRATSTLPKNSREFSVTSWAEDSFSFQERNRQEPLLICS